MLCHPIASTHTMLVDLYDEDITYGKSGQPLRTWAKIDEIACLARGILGQGIRVVGSSQTFIAEDYEDVEVVKLRTTYEDLHKGMRMSNIRDGSSGKVLWKDKDGPITFSIDGITPVFDPFNTVIEYDVLLRGITND